MTLMASAMASVLIDGSVLEGGGQILRNSVSLSALLSKAVSIYNIRHGRKPPGLKNQHRTGLQLAAEISSARLTGATNGSATIEFMPGRMRPGHFTADSMTAGSTTLLLQIALPLLLFTSSHSPPSSLTLRGGTNATQAPQIDYAKHVFLPFVRKHFGLEGVDLEIKKRGYFPKGGGEVFVTMSPLLEGGSDARLKPMSLLHRGQVVHIGGIAHFAGLPAKVGRDMVDGARQQLESWSTLNSDSQKIPIRIEYRRERDEDTTGAGSGIVLWAELEGGGIVGGSAVGRKGIDPAKVGEEAAMELMRGLDCGGCVDEWLQDQIIIFMALAEGMSEVKCGIGGLSLHTETAIWVAHELTDAKFEVVEESSGHTIIRCQGIGYVAAPTASSENTEHV